MTLFLQSVQTDSAPSPIDLTYGGKYLNLGLTQLSDLAGGVGGSHIHQSEDSSMITLYKDSSEAYRLPEGYFISQLSVLSFDFQETEASKACAVCVDNGIDAVGVDTSGRPLRSPCYVLVGNMDNPAKRGPSSLDFTTKTRVSVRLHELFPSRVLPIRYIAFVRVNSDNSLVAGGGGEASFSNLHMYEVSSILNCFLCNCRLCHVVQA